MRLVAAVTRTSASSRLSESGQHVVDPDLRIGSGERRDAVAPCMLGDAPVVVSGRIAVDLKTGIGEGEDPLLGDPAPRVQALLDGSVVVQRLVRYLDDQQLPTSGGRPGSRASRP